MERCRRTLLAQLKVMIQSKNLQRTLSRQTYCRFQSPPLSRAALPTLPYLELDLSTPGREVFSTPYMRCLSNVQTALIAGPFELSSLKPPRCVLTARLLWDRQTSAGERERADFPSQFPHFHFTLSVWRYRRLALLLRHQRIGLRMKNCHHLLLLPFSTHSPKLPHTRTQHLQTRRTDLRQRPAICRASRLSELCHPRTPVRDNRRT